MNINDPAISRMLAILIQPVVAEDRRRFVYDAEQAEDMDSFIESLDEYETE
jgi:tagatose-1,6-bisphosphate aldolase non-catalytic subunit AgaZ/GatZ